MREEVEMEMLKPLDVLRCRMEETRNALDDLVDRAMDAASEGEKICSVQMTHEDGSVLRVPLMMWDGVDTGVDA